MTRPTDTEDHQPREVAEVAAAILRYVNTRPHAGDTLVGISDWWLPQSCDEPSETTVVAALKLPVERGQLSERPGVGGDLVYLVQDAHPPGVEGRAASPREPAP